MIRSTACKYRPNQCFSLAKTIDSSSILQITDNDPVVFLRTLGGGHDRAGRMPSNAGSMSREIFW